MRNLTEFFGRLVGPVAFAIAIALVITLYGQFTSYQEAVFQDSAEQAIVIQEMTDASNNRVLTYSELISRLVGGPTVDTMISITTTGERFLIQLGRNDYQITVMQGDVVKFAKTVEQEDWHRSEFPYRLLKNCNYRTIETYNSDGSLKTVTYVELREE